MAKRKYTEQQIQIIRRKEAERRQTQQPKRTYHPKKRTYPQKAITPPKLDYTETEKKRLRAKLDGFDKYVKEKKGKWPRLQQRPYPYFRRYKKSDHPALILTDIDGKVYAFRRVTSSEMDGHHPNERVSPNPDRRRETDMYIVKRIEFDYVDKFDEYYNWKYPKKEKRATKKVALKAGDGF